MWYIKIQFLRLDYFVDKLIKKDNFNMPDVIIKVY